MDGFVQWLQTVCYNLIPLVGDSEKLIEALGQQEFILAAYVILNVVIFTETGLLVGFFLPGDSLLVTTGIVVSTNPEGWNLPLLMATLCASAVIGDTVGYLIGYRAGPRLFRKEKSLLFRKDYLIYAQDYYAKHGGKTIVIARFIPFLRTFAPVVAGIGKMHYTRFLSYNVFGGIGWICSMLLFGYFLSDLLDEALKPVFGPEFQIRKHIDMVIIFVVMLSVSPAIYAGAVRLFRKTPHEGGTITPRENQV